MTNVKAYKDGNRLIIVVENCTGEVAGKVNDFLLDIIGTAQPKVVPALLPQNAVEEAAPEIRVEDEITPQDPAPFAAPSSKEAARACAVPGASGTLGHALDVGDTEAIAKLVTMVHKMDESLKHTVVAMCKKYILDDCIRRNPAEATTNEIRRFFSDYRPLIKATMNEILSKAGYADIDLFFAHANMVQQQGAYQSILDELVARVKK